MVAIIIEATMEADKKAFVALMHYLKNADAEHTVIMVQVENQPGAWGTVRDYSAAAQKLFVKPVPAVLLQPDILRALGHPDAAQGLGRSGVAAGSWAKVFGADADEYFQAWYVAHFIGEVAAPAIDLVAPDIYLSGHDKCLKVIELYTRRDNALFVPEDALAGDKVRYLYSVLACGGIGLVAGIIGA